MYQSSNLQTPPEALTAYLQQQAQSARDPMFRRRAVLIIPPSKSPVLLGCTVEAFPEQDHRPSPQESRGYPEAVLHEDWLTAEACTDFVAGIQKGSWGLSEGLLPRSKAAMWHLEMLSVPNQYMSRAGLLVRTSYEERDVQKFPGPLLNVKFPYYPDIMSAASDWLPIGFSGERDGRKNEIIFVLPEPRAYFARAEHDGGILKIDVAGTQADLLGLVVKAIYWKNGMISHAEELVREGTASLQLPEDVERLEYVLITADGQLFDFQREGRFRPSSLRKIGRANKDSELRSRLDAACASGEGMKVEFKPFIDDVKSIGGKNEKTKFREVVTSVVAFANAAGGEIFLGVNDDCEVVGINKELAAWMKSEPNESALEKYRGSLIQGIRGNVEGHVDVQAEGVSIDGLWVVVIKVKAGLETPSAVKGDLHLYARVGANNKRIPPDQFASHLKKVAPEHASLFSDAVSASRVGDLS